MIEQRQDDKGSGVTKWKFCNAPCHPDTMQNPLSYQIICMVGNKHRLTMKKKAILGYNITLGNLGACISTIACFQVIRIHSIQMV